jgi:hypothetical protein
MIFQDMSGWGVTHTTTVKARPITKVALVELANGFAGSRVARITMAMKLLMKSSVMKTSLKFFWVAFGNEQRTLPDLPLKLRIKAPPCDQSGLKIQSFCLDWPTKKRPVRKDANIWAKDILRDLPRWETLFT